jgi:hypothetical protein
MPEGAMRISKWRLTYIAALLSVIAGLSSYGWYIYTLVRDAQAYKPQPQIERLLKDLLTYHQQTKQFPRNFDDINQRLWHTTPPPDYGKDRREARTKNYYYWYTYVKIPACSGRCPPASSDSMPRRFSSSSRRVGCGRGRARRAVMRKSIIFPPFLPLRHSLKCRCRNCLRACSRRRPNLYLSSFAYCAKA